MTREHLVREIIVNIDESLTLEEQEKIDKIGLIISKIHILKEKLKDYDYIGTKIATGRATIKEYSTQIEEMNLWANKINGLENDLVILKKELEQLRLENNNRKEISIETPVTEEYLDTENDVNDKAKNELVYTENSETECILIINDPIEQEVTEDEEI